LLSALLLATWASSAHAATAVKGDYLLKVAPEQVTNVQTSLKARLPSGTFIEDLGLAGWLHVRLPSTAVSSLNTTTILNQPGVLKMHPNYIIKLMDTWSIRDPKMRKAFIKKIQDGFPFPGDGGGFGNPPPDNPDIPTSGSGGSGMDPLYSKQWGMNQMGV